MNPTSTISPATIKELEAIYDQVMWLANRPDVTAGQARGWYTGMMREAVKRKVCVFTGQVSERAASSDSGPLVLEHHKRLAHEITTLVTKHRDDKLHRPEEFVQLVIKFESVHIVTDTENHAAQAAKGDYAQAGITLVSWTSLTPARRSELWSKMLRGNVVNARTYQR